MKMMFQCIADGQVFSTLEEVINHAITFLSSPKTDEWEIIGNLSNYYRLIIVNTKA